RRARARARARRRLRLAEIVTSRSQRVRGKRHRRMRRRARDKSTRRSNLAVRTSAPGPAREGPGSRWAVRDRPGLARGGSAKTRENYPVARWKTPPAATTGCDTDDGCAEVNVRSSARPSFGSRRVMRNVIYLAVLLAASSAAAQSVEEARTCQVTIARAPDDVREVVEAWVRSEPQCSKALEVRIVPTEGGLYLLAQDEQGRIRDRVVPDAETAGVLVASWIADDHAPAPVRSVNPF